MSSSAPATKPQLPPISQILNSELYSSSDGLPPPPPHSVVSEDPLIRKVQNWKDYDQYQQGVEFILVRFIYVCI
ncbi:unnamed protein product [Candida parapsilosis]